MIKKIVFVLLLFLLSGCTLLQKQQEEINISSSELNTAFADDLTAASEQYDDKVATVTGMAYNTEDRGTYVKVYFYDDIVCEFPDIEGVAVDINKYDNLTFTGTILGANPDVSPVIGPIINMEDCDLVSINNDTDIKLTLGEFMQYDLSDFLGEYVEVTGVLWYKLEFLNDLVVLGDLETGEYYEFYLEKEFDFSSINLNDIITLKFVVIQNYFSYDIVNCNIINIIPNENQET